MKIKKMRLLSFSVLATLILSSTPVFASTTINTTSKSTVVNSEKGVKLASKSQVNYTVYTYSNAPADVKANYEANCKSANVIPNASDEILIPTTSNNIKTAKNSVGATITVGATIKGIYYNSSTGKITAEMSYTSAAGYQWTVYSYAYTSDYIGYGHITSGDKVKCLQAALDYRFGYSLAVDGLFGTNTQNAILNVQRSHSLSEDGIVGPSTWKAILGA